jgi:transcriptional regulator with XRE-family HTH domain
MPAKGGGSSRGVGETQEELSAVFGANFREARLKAGLTQVEVAARTGIQQAYLSGIESGRKNLTLSTMVTLARIVGTDVRTLLKRPPDGAKSVPRRR